MKKGRPRIAIASKEVMQWITQNQATYEEAAEHFDVHYATIFDRVKKGRNEFPQEYMRMKEMQGHRKIAEMKRVRSYKQS